MFMLEEASSSCHATSRPPRPARHHLTIDVEEFFHSTLLTARIPAATWDALPRRAPAVTEWLLEQMAAVGASGTFFVLGWLAEKEPALVRRISDEGHEVAAHSWWHRRVDSLSPEEFRSDARKTKAFLEDLCGRAVVGFRAPSFSIRPGFEWAFDVLLEEGYKYDSSLFPISVHPSYGYPAAKSDPYWLTRSAGTLLEVPLLTLGFGGRRLPAAGGAYLRFFPAALPRVALRQAERRGESGTLYVHPWDLDPHVKRIRLPPLLALRLWGGANAAKHRLRDLLRGFRFTSIAQTLAGLTPAGAPGADG